ncbi:hypothetical protein Nepgr_012875 [Nepenthes gracilis]|uniref:Ubiquitin-like domain-containing protein n=1 Tax=Nepenthes gracilis TaxID=150966 RepID=A0AAD3SI14_NEPGR|nr:hypothetical protein Nepgr_012875 [Nepenthes gracilis]
MRVIIVTGINEFSIEIGCRESVREIKQKVENILDIPVASQTLAVFGWELIDGLDMDDYPVITEGTRIDLKVESAEGPALEPYNKIQITIKFSSRRLNVEVERTETVRSLKEKIHIIDGTPIKRMALYFSGVEMEEEFRHLSEYGVSQFSEVAVALKSMSRLRAEPHTRRLSLVVQTSTSLLNAASIPLEINDVITVGEARQLLLTMGILPVDDYIFIHKQRIMHDNSTLRWHGVENGDHIYVFKGTVSRSSH